MPRIEQSKVNRAGVQAIVYLLGLEPYYSRAVDGLRDDLSRIYQVTGGRYKVDHDGSTVAFSPMSTLITVECRSHQLLSALLLASLASSDAKEEPLTLTVVICDDGRQPEYLHLLARKGEIHGTAPSA